MAETNPLDEITVPQAAEEAGVTRAALNHAVRTGALKANRVDTPRGPVYLVQRGALQAYMSGRKYNAAPVPPTYRPPIWPYGERAEESTETLTPEARKLVLILIDEVRGMGFDVPDRTDDEHIEAVRKVDHPHLLNEAASGDREAIHRLAELHWLFGQREERLAERIASLHTVD